MVRPREGGFCYTDFDYMTCCRDMEALLNAGADGIVFGFLKPDGTVDTDRCADFIGKIKKINPNARLCSTAPLTWCRTYLKRSMILLPSV